jgi:hypothetical protein
MTLQLSEDGTEVIRMTQEEYQAKLKELKDQTERLSAVQVVEPPRPSKPKGRPPGNTTTQIDTSALESQLQGIQKDIERLLLRPDYVDAQNVQLKQIQEQVQYLYNSVYQEPVQPRKKFLGIF